ncbi:hypothetical protein AURDEDRAFT_166105 [Auricularia subglabra TFB-10046 SS5]|nr:hypothetical protein AURDEDRAFT_166105 [Auricularia subglabra TFB-10046 SS5]
MSFLDIYAGDLGSAESPSDFSVHSDVLRTLNWNTGKVCDASLVRRMHLPALETAFLSFYERSEVPDDTVTAFLRHPMCNVHCLTLELLEVAILDGLQYTRRVTTLRFQDFTETSEAALQGLSGHTSETGGWLCPLLAHVTFPSYADSEKFDIASLHISKTCSAFWHDVTFKKHCGATSCRQSRADDQGLHCARYRFGTCDHSESPNSLLSDAQVSGIGALTRSLCYGAEQA